MSNQCDIINDRYVRQLLMALLAEIETFGELDIGQKSIIDPYLADMRYIGIPYSPTQWFGKSLPVTQRKAYSRAAKRLEQAGLVVSIMEPNRSRITHLRLTADGLRRALDLVGANADLITIAEGLQKTAWGSDCLSNLQLLHAARHCQIRVTDGFVPGVPKDALQES